VTLGKRPLRGLVRLLRPSNLPTVWTNALAAAVLVGAGPPRWLWLLCAASLSAFYMGGMALNDLYDREWDAEHRPERPLPSGELAEPVARWAAALLLGLGLGLLVLTPFPRLGVGAGLALLAAIIGYDRLHKIWSPAPLLMAACRVLTFVVTALAMAGRVGWPVWTVASLQLAWVLLLTVMARAEGRGRLRLPSTTIPWMIAGIAVVDGSFLAALVSPWYLAVGLGAALLTRLAQRWVPGN